MKSNKVVACFLILIMMLPIISGCTSEAATSAAGENKRIGRSRPGEGYKSTRTDRKASTTLGS